MSTISDALKKAQKQRQGSLPEPASIVPPHPPQNSGTRPFHPVPAPQQPSGKPSFILILICVSALTSGIVVYCLRGTEGRDPKSGVGDQISEIGKSGSPTVMSAAVPKAEAPVVTGVPPADHGGPLKNTESIPERLGETPRPAEMKEISQGRANRPAEPKLVQQPSGGPAENKFALDKGGSPAPATVVHRTDIPVLGGTFYSEQNPVAIINGSAMKEGETIGVYKVVKILPYSVKLQCDGEDIEIRLK